MLNAPYVREREMTVLSQNDFKQKFNTVLSGYLQHYSGELQHPIANLVSAGGKRTRPYLAYLCSLGNERNLNIDNERFFTGMIPELIHTASLAHDDIMDNSSVRRGQPTIHSKWNTKIAVLSGDLLLAFVLKIIGRLDGRIPFIIEEVVSTIEAMIEGQTIEDTLKHSENVPDICVLEEINKLKTGSLFSLSFYVGTALRSDNGVLLKRSKKAGMIFGKIFQIYDDVLDIFGEKNTIGKEPLRDIEEGVLTIPYAIALNNNKEFLHILRSYKKTLNDNLLPAIKEIIIGEAGKKILMETKHLVKEYSSAVEAMDLYSPKPLIDLVESLYREIEHNLR